MFDLIPTCVKAFNTALTINYMYHPIFQNSSLTTAHKSASIENHLPYFLENPTPVLLKYNSKSNATPIQVII